MWGNVMSYLNPEPVKRGAKLGAIARWGSHEKMRDFLEKGLEIDMEVEYDNRTPLQHAAARGSLSRMQMLLEHGAQIDTANPMGFTALHYAAYYGHAECVKFLLDNGADPMLADHHLNTAADAALSEFPGIAAYINERILQMKTYLPPADMTCSSQWNILSEKEIVKQSEKPFLARRLTEIFNFETRSCTIISENLKTKAETLTLISFRDMADTLLVDKAAEAFRDISGEYPQGYGEHASRKKIALAPSSRENVIEPSRRETEIPPPKNP